jgi:hypothetical protein
VHGAAAGRVDHPVEGDGQQEEGEQVQDLVVDRDGGGVELEGGQACVAGDEEEEGEYACCE